MTRPQLKEIDRSSIAPESQYDVPRPQSLRTTLLQYIDQEYIAIEERLQVRENNNRGVS